MEQNLPANRLDDKVIRYDKAESIVSGIFLIIAGALLVVVTLYFDWPTWLNYIWITASIVISLIDYLILPALRLRSIRYEVHPTYLEILEGGFFRSRELIPIERIQHVEIKDGPISRKYHVQSVKVTTAGTNHEIPLLLEDDAQRLHDQIVQLIKHYGVKSRE